MLETRRPLPGRDYPQTSDELLELARSEVACRDLVERVRWPDGFTCPACQAHDVPWRSGTGVVACRHCRRPVFLTRHTPFHSASIPLSRWLLALWEVCDHESIDEAHLARVLGGSGDEALSQAHNLVASLRAAMALAVRQPLTGTVQLGHAELVVEQGSSKRRLRHKVQLALAVVLGDHEALAVRMQTLHRRDRMAVLDFARQSVSDTADIAKSGVGETAVQRVASLLELWLGSQRVGNDDSLAAHLDEFCFRFERRLQPRGRAFYDLLLACLLGAHGRRRRAPALTGS